MKTVTVTVELDENEALALAQFCKRVGWSDCRGCSASDDEAYEQVAAIGKVRCALGNEGYAPR